MREACPALPRPALDDCALGAAEQGRCKGGVDLQKNTRLGASEVPP
eukprot:SAG31_NODE_23461_length_504_cov_0.488889_1_plen_45_part_10